MTVYGAGKLGYINKRREPSVVTQSADAAAVLCSTKSGRIVTATLTAIAGAEHTFVVTNAAFLTTSSVVVSIGSYTGTGTAVLSVSLASAGSFSINISNVHAATALTSTMTINYVISDI